MRWWCSQLYEPWSWTPRPYLGVWIAIVSLVIVRIQMLRSQRATHAEIDLSRRQRRWFWLGLGAFWAASDWPIATLGSGYLASVHMAQFMLYTLVAAPLLLLSMPAWQLEALLARPRIGATIRAIARPLPAAILANAILIATNAPWTVDNLRVSQIGSVALDITWFVGGLALWLPVISPVDELRVPHPLVRCAYLFGAAGLTPMIPGGFLTFADAPLYRTYEVAPRVGLDPLADQQLAGAIMKVGAVPIIWIVMAVIFVRWARTDDRTPRRTSGALRSLNA